MNRSFLNQFWIYSSLFLAFVIDIYVTPEVLILWKPVLTLLVLIYWNMALPDRVGIFEALLFGLLLDVSTGALLGLHAALFVLITYICQRFFYQFRVSPMWQQSVTLFFLFFIFKLAFGFDFNDMAPGLNLSDRNYLLDSFLFSLIMSLIWTHLFFILRELRRRKIRI